MLYRFSLIATLLALVACGGGGGGGGSSASGGDTPVDTTTYSISGTISNTINRVVDSDINDFSTTPVSNDQFDDAQEIENLSIVQGFASADETQGLGGTSSDNFFNDFDRLDFYRVTLQENQSVTMQVVDYNGIDVFQGDLDLYIYDSDLNQVDFSNTLEEFEYVSIAEGGEYFIEVYAYSGISKYVLQINSTLDSTHAKPRAAEFMPNEAIVKLKETSGSKAFKSAMGVAMSNAGDKRPSLATFSSDLVEAKSFGVSSALSSKVFPSNKRNDAFLRALEKRNPKAHQKRVTSQMIKDLSLRPDVEYAEPNYMRYTMLEPNDELYRKQWHYPAINLPQAWEVTTGAPESGQVIVAVVDTGVFLAHEDLQGQLVDGFDFIRDPEISRDGGGIDNNPDDPGDSSLLGSSSWHGTHVAGTIAARTDNTTGIAGVSWDAKIMPIRVLGEGGGTSYDIMQGLRFAAGLSNDSGTVPAQAADIINLSLGGRFSSASEQQTINAVRAEGVILIAAAGNENTSALAYPASYDGVISVSATDAENERAPYSNFGTAIDIAAPGGNTMVDANSDRSPDGVLSALVDKTTNPTRSIYAYYQGTSMATPHVSGVVALMKAIYPALTPDELDTLIAAGDLTNDIGTTGRDDNFGYGLIDALKAVQEASSLAAGGALPDLPPIISASPSSLVFNNSVTGALLTISNQGGDGSITGVSTSEPWLSVSESSVDADKMGTYSVSVDGSGLGNSFYRAEVMFTISNESASSESTLTVPVSFVLSAADDFGDTGRPWVVLIDDVGDSVSTKLGTSIGSGQYSYLFTDVSPGSYLIVGGSDIDNDEFLCQYGETCGAYPIAADIQEVVVEDSNLTNLDFTVDIIYGVSANALESKDALGISRSSDKLDEEHVDQNLRNKMLTP